ncbi:MAG TPA: alpha/beta fold hydrolase [Vicinamibacterales bacterium]|nr:alpha/beta fold hydrolase [Vicinamibacterales bacterium]
MIARRVAGFVVFIVGLAVLSTKMCAGSALAGQEPRALGGAWRGRIGVAGVTLEITVVFTESAGAASGTIDIPQQGARGLALRNVRHEGNKVHFELPAGPSVAIFDGALEDGRISGTFTQGPAVGSFTLAPGAAPEPPAPREAVPYREEEITFANGAVSLAGTLTMPQGTGPFSAVALLTGSGPQNRDEELFGFKPFREIADYFTRRGIAVLRWDDRGIGGSTGGGPDVTTADFATDALAAVEWLRARPGIRRDRIGLLGHSEGGLAALIAAAESPDIAFIVMLAGPALKGETILRSQAEAIARAGGASEETVAALSAQQDLLFRAVRTGEGWDEVIARARAAASLKGGPGSGGKPNPALETVIQAQIRMAKSGWYRFYLDFDPASPLQRTSCPILAVFGELDTQVPAAANAAALESIASRTGRTNVTTKVYPGANHLFIPARTGAPSEYAALEKKFVDGLLDDLSRWIEARVK